MAFHPKKATAVAIKSEAKSGENPFMISVGDKALFPIPINTKKIKSSEAMIIRMKFQENG
ncbi:hypothetical protein D3C80_1208830 [compost metagenome]